MYRRSENGWRKHIDFIIADLIILHFSFCFGYIIRHGMKNPYQEQIYLEISITMTLISLLVSIFSNSFKNVLRRGYYQEFAATVKHACLVGLLEIFYLFVVKMGSEYSRMTFLIFEILYIMGSYIERCLLKEYLRRKKKNTEERSLLILTNEALAEEVITNLQSQKGGDWFISGAVILDRDMRGSKVEGVEVVADADHVIEYVKQEWVDEVFICAEEGIPYPDHLLNELSEMGITVHIRLMKTGKLFGKNQFVEQLGDYTVLTSCIKYATPLQMLIKRSMDILGGLAGCLITGILFLFLAPVIYISSPGPVFFTQIRVGKNGKKFEMYKFRSMYMDAEKRKKELLDQNRIKDGRMFKLDFDPRIIGAKKLPDGTVKKGIGNFIRDYSLDEFPQFFNVLKGDMSLVGTRPPTLDEWETYENHHRVRLAVKPGMTGMWQISGRSDITDFEEVVRLDREYITEWSMGLDLRILLKTIPAVLKRKGSR